MIPIGAAHTLGIERFPRVSGDDPENGDWDTFVQRFSPRERG